MVATPIVMAYFVSWSIYAPAYFVSNITANKLTHINYAFANIDSNGKITLGDAWADTQITFPNDIQNLPFNGNFNQLLVLKQNYPHLQTLISVGGYTWSGSFSNITQTAASRSTFAQSCVTFIQQYGFDGVDIDWEYPASLQDTQNYVLLLQELRQELNAAGSSSNKTYLLTVATPVGTQNIANLNLSGMSTYVDWFNVMTYDFHGSWEVQTGHNAALYENNAENVADVPPSYIKSRCNCDAAIQAYIAGGVPRSKIVMGLPLYGRGWQGVTSTTLNGFSQPASSTPPVGTFESGVFDYYDVVENYLPTYTRYWDNASKVPFLFNTTKGIWISYDDVQSISGKSEYIIQQQLGGAMFWDLSGDPNGDLVGAAFTTLTIGQTTTSTTSTARTTTSSQTTNASTTRASTSTTSTSTTSTSTTSTSTTSTSTTSTSTTSTSTTSTSTTSTSTTSTSTTSTSTTSTSTTSTSTTSTSTTSTSTTSTSTTSTSTTSTSTTSTSTTSTSTTSTSTTSTSTTSTSTTSTSITAASTSTASTSTTGTSTSTTGTSTSTTSTSTTAASTSTTSTSTTSTSTTSTSTTSTSTTSTSTTSTSTTSTSTTSTSTTSTSTTSTSTTSTSTTSTSTTSTSTTSTSTTSTSTTKASTSTASVSTTGASTSTTSTSTTGASTSTTSTSTTAASTSTASTSTIKATSGNPPEWGPLILYNIGSQVTYEGNTYQCIQSHTSLSNWIPPAVPALWKPL